MDVNDEPDWQLKAELRETRAELERTRRALAEMTAVANRLELELLRAKEKGVS